MKVWAFSDFQNQVKSNIDNFKCLFQKEDDGGTGGKCTCVQLIVINKELSNHCIIPFGFRKGKQTKKLELPVQSYLQFFFYINLLNARDKANPISYYCGPWFEVKQVTKPGKSFVVFGWSWCAICVLGSQVFGQAWMESSAGDVLQTPLFPYTYWDGKVST